MHAEKLEKLRTKYPAAAALIEGGRCPFCTKKVFQSELRNEIEQNEFSISGLCHPCQVQFFNSDGSLKA